MKQFLKQQLSKRQLGQIKGGTVYECVAFVNGLADSVYHIEAADAMEAADRVHKATGADQVNCTRA